MTEARGPSTQSGLDPPLTVDPRVLAEIRDLHDRGRTMRAWQRATAMAALSSWRGTEQRLLAMRLLQATGARPGAERLQQGDGRAVIGRVNPKTQFERPMIFTGGADAGLTASNRYIFPLRGSSAGFTYVRPQGPIA
jgi:hypothetical protein